MPWGWGCKWELVGVGNHSVIDETLGMSRQPSSPLNGGWKRGRGGWGGHPECRGVGLQVGVGGGWWVAVWWSTRRCARLINLASPLLAGECEGRVIRMAIRHVVGVGSRVGVGGAWVGVWSSTRHYVCLVNLASPSLEGGNEGGVVGMAIRNVMGVGSQLGVGGGWVGVRSSTRRCARLVNPVSSLLAGGCEGRVVGMAIRHVVGWGRERGWWGLGRCSVIDETLCMSCQPRIPLIGRWK